MFKLGRKMVKVGRTVFLGGNVAVPPSLRPSVPLSLRPSVPPSLQSIQSTYRSRELLRCFPPGLHGVGTFLRGVSRPLMLN